ncbi:hypothetical protein [Clostridium perfringens]|uniref:hypothetical protein n=1 Tax=Clostridium perfringens TaxID=1502 RepID=UPI00096A3B88|nr:hypothetical protein [Clostridium perfringens]
MFNNNIGLSNKNIVSNHINAITGAITKTYTKSFFLRFNLKSEMAERLLDHDPCYYYKEEGDCWSTRHSVKVLQMVMCGDMEVLAEVIFENDYNEILEEQKNII